MRVVLIEGTPVCDARLGFIVGEISARVKRLSL
jgi:hypothetical protein